MTVIENVSDTEELGLAFEDIGTMLHGILFAYQKANREILGSGSAVFVHPILNIMKRIQKRTGINLIEGRNLDEVLEHLSQAMPTSGIVGGFRFEKLGSKRYVLHIDGCVWAPHIHEELQPRDVTCPLALIAMAVFEEVAKTKVKVVDSEYTEDGTITKIEPL